MKKLKVKIISSWSNPGGSATAFVNLCNLFNLNGIDCTFYGPHNWHLDKCQASTLDSDPFSDDTECILISHFCQVPAEHEMMEKNVRKHILSCHETNLFPLKNLKLDQYDLIHYVSNSQRRWHATNYPYKVIPNVLSELENTGKNPEVAGVIGSIDPHKQVHTSVERALKDGYKKVLVYGNPTDIEYLRKFKSVLTQPGVEAVGYEDDKQKMYDSVGEVYHSSQRETFNYIKAECQMTGTKYNGLDSAESHADYWDNERILESWISLLL